MRKKNKRHTSLLQYWTTRYLMILFIGLIVIGAVSYYWIQASSTEKRIQVLKIMAEEISEQVVDDQGRLVINPRLSIILERRQHFLNLNTMPFFFIVNKNQEVIYSQPKHHPPLPVMPLTDTKDVVKVNAFHHLKVYMVKKKIAYNDELLGWVLILYPQMDVPRNDEQLQFLIVMLISLALLGWGVIYLLTRKLSRPIKDVADAAKQIVSGDYHVELNKRTFREKEIFELNQSFKNMADRLRQLEMMRTELLAGVTHELKTPVAAISGLIQAVKDKVVTGAEADEFLDICNNESYRLQKMVEDLLDFNSFVIGDMKVRKENFRLNQLLQDIVNQWLIVLDDPSFLIDTVIPENQIDLHTDSTRVQQILYNLLNNSKQALRKDKPRRAKEDGEEHHQEDSDFPKIDIGLYEEAEAICIDVTDNGSGIAEEEQQLIFERFYRGKAKKQKLRGLGLGLTYSKMLAKSLGGDLVLKQSSEAGTTFTLLLPKS